MAICPNRFDLFTLATETSWLATQIVLPIRSGCCLLSPRAGRASCCSAQDSPTAFAFATGRPLLCDCFLDVAPEAAEHFLKHMSKARPVFGFACLPGERGRRNRVTTQQGPNEIESWVGRDTQRYVPGLYWLALLSEALARQHHVALSALEAVAQEHVELEGGLHLFRFYERPEGWLETSAVTELCTSLSGVFDVEKIKPQTLGREELLGAERVDARVEVIAASGDYPSRVRKGEFDRDDPCCRQPIEGRHTRRRARDRVAWTRAGTRIANGSFCGSSAFRVGEKCLFERS